MITFNFDQFLLDNRLGIYELADKSSIPVQTLYAIKNRGTVKIKFIRELERHFGDLSNYITINSKRSLPRKERV